MSQPPPSRRPMRRYMGKLVLVLMLVLAAGWLTSQRLRHSTAPPSPMPVDSPVLPPDDPAAQRESTMEEVLQFAREALAHIESSVDDYRGRLVKREEVGGRLIEEAEMVIKLQ